MECRGVRDAVPRPRLVTEKRDSRREKDAGQYMALFSHTSQGEDGATYADIEVFEYPVLVPHFFKTCDPR